MNQEVKKLWIDALRSGKYKQTKGVLRTEDSFCCLGVLCDIYHKQTNEGKWDGDCFIANPTDFSSCVLPRTIVGYAELPDENPTTKTLINREEVGIIEDGYGNSLAVLNDAGVDFNRIADIIETDL